MFLWTHTAVACGTFGTTPEFASASKRLAAIRACTTAYSSRSGGSMGSSCSRRWILDPDVFFPRLRLRWTPSCSRAYPRHRKILWMQSLPGSDRARARAARLKRLLSADARDIGEKYCFASTGLDDIVLGALAVCPQTRPFRVSCWCTRSLVCAFGASSRLMAPSP